LTEAYLELQKEEPLTSEASNAQASPSESPILHTSNTDITETEAPEDTKPQDNGAGVNLESSQEETPLPSKATSSTKDMPEVASGPRRRVKAGTSIALTGSPRPLS